MKIVKKVCSEYYVEMDFLKFLEISELKIKIFKYIIDSITGEYEGIKNLVDYLKEEESIDWLKNLKIN